MTTAEMITLLGYRLEDTGKDVFDDPLLYLMLNIAQDKLIQFLNAHLLTEIQNVKTDITLTEDTNLPADYNDYFNESGLSLSTPMFGGLTGIFAIKDRTTGDFYTTKTSFENIQGGIDAVSAMLSDKINPAYPGTSYFFLLNRVYLHPGLNKVDVYYLEEPTAMADGVNSDLNKIYHDALIELAEFECWTTVKDYKRAQDAFKRAMVMIEGHNTNVPATTIPDQRNDPNYQARHI